MKKMNKNTIFDESILRENIRKESDSLLREYVTQTEKEYSGLYVGKVVDVNDPEKLGRCRIRVFNVFSESIPTEALPWALPLQLFNGSKKGSFTVPDEDTVVAVQFLNGNIYEPIFFLKFVDSNNLPNNKDENYPKNEIFFETEEGDSFEINKGTGITKFIHNSGTTIEIEKSGKVNILANQIEVKTNSSFVTPDAAKGGPFCALKFDTLTGLPLQGNSVFNNIAGL
ncbi:MAG: phage baseplate assembly protein V [bacterium]